jgi:uncharacterized protein Veg
MIVKIQRLTEQEEWVDFKIVDSENAWIESINEVYTLNSEGGQKYRALHNIGNLTEIYCSTFYLVPNIGF